MSEDKSKNNLSSNRRYLTFFLNKELYGIAIERVEEIIAMMKITPVPKTPEYIKGVMNLRGNIIPVVDMRLKFGMEYKENDMYTAIIIVSINDTSIGFIVDTVQEVTLIKEEELSEAPNFGASIDTSFISEIARRDDEVIMLLDLQKVFAEDEIANFEKMTKQ